MISRQINATVYRSSSQLTAAISAAPIKYPQIKLVAVYRVIRMYAVSEIAYNYQTGAARSGPVVRASLVRYVEPVAVKTYFSKRGYSEI